MLTFAAVNLIIYNTIMKLRTLITTLLLALCSLGAAAQDSYTEALTRYFKANGSSESMRLQMTALLTNYTQQSGLKVPAGYTAESIVQKYYDTDFINDYASIYKPYFAAHVPLSELNTLCAELESPAGSTAIKHNIAFCIDPQGYLEMSSLGQIAAMDIVAGKKPADVTPTATPERSKLFEEYYVATGQDKIIEAITTSMLRSMGDISPDLINEFSDFCKRNLKIKVCNMSEDFLTDEDLRFCIKLYQMPESAHANAVVMEALSDPQAFGNALVTAYTAWLDKQ